MAVAARSSRSLANHLRKVSVCFDSITPQMQFMNYLDARRFTRLSSFSVPLGLKPLFHAARQAFHARIPASGLSAVVARP